MPNYGQIGSTAGGLIGGPIGAGIGGLVGGAVSLIAGAGQKKKGRALINQPYPEETIPTEVTQAAAEGLPAQQYAQAMKNIQRQQAAAISQSQDRRGGLATIGRTQLATDDAMGKLDAANAAARMHNQQRLGTWKDKIWQANVKDKYNRDYNYGMSLLGAGNQNFTSGLDKIGGGLGLIAGGGGFKGLFGGSNNGVTDYSGGGNYTA
jgi:hypothetical protein